MKTDNNIRSYIKENEARFLDELFSLIRIPSISAEPAHKADMLQCAERWRELLIAAGVDHAEVMPSAGNPLVLPKSTLMTMHQRCSFMVTTM